MFKVWLPKSAVVPAILASCFGALGSVLLGTTHLYLIEQYVCKEYYNALRPQTDLVLLIGANGDIDEKLCKDPAIQSTVAGIQGVYMFLMFMPGEYPLRFRKVTLNDSPALFLAGPWGQLSKILGKKTIIFLNGCSVFSQACFYTGICKY